MLQDVKLWCRGRDMRLRLQVAGPVPCAPGRVAWGGAGGLLSASVMFLARAGAPAPQVSSPAVRGTPVCLAQSRRPLV